MFFSFLVSGSSVLGPHLAHLFTQLMRRLDTSVFRCYLLRSCYGFPSACFATQTKSRHASSAFHATRRHLMPGGTDAEYADLRLTHSTRQTRPCLISSIMSIRLVLTMRLTMASLFPSQCSSVSSPCLALQQHRSNVVACSPIALFGALQSEIAISR